MDTYLIEITGLFEIQKVNGCDLAIIKYNNFIEFLKFLPSSEIARFAEYQKNLCPQDVSSKEFLNWAIYVISKYGLKQNEICKLIGISAPKLSNFLNEKGGLTIEERLELKKELLRDLISKKVINP